VIGRQTSEEVNGRERLTSLLAYLYLWKINSEIHEAIDGFAIVRDSI